MYAEGDYISYGRNGVCKVEAITLMDVPDTPQKRMYYILKPVYNQNGTIYSPVDVDKPIIRRPVLTKEEALHLLEEASEVDRITVKDRTQFESLCKQAIQSGDCKEWIKVIKTLWLEKKNRETQGKKLTSSNEKFLKAAEENLFGELAISLKTEKTEIEQLLKKSLDFCRDML